MMPFVAIVLATLPVTTVQTLVRLPDLDAEEMSTMRVIASIAPKRTDDFSRPELLAITGGRPPKMTLVPGYLRLSVTVPGDDALTAVSVTESILRRASFDTTELSATIRRVTDDHRSYWQAALEPYAIAKPKQKREEILYLYHRVFLPANIELAVAGSDPRKVQEEWLKRTDNWTAPRRVGPILAPLPVEPLSRNPGGVTTYELRGKEFAADDAALPTRLLALIALGTGKGSTLYRVWREREVWSYRQESVLWPTKGGWQPRLIAAMPSPPEPGAPKKGALEDIEGWTEVDRVRALEMAEAVYLNDVDFDPIYPGTDPLAPESLEDRTFLAAYWRAKTGSRWDPVRLVEQMRLIKLGELKEAAADLVNGSTAVVLPS